MAVAGGTGQNGFDQLHRPVSRRNVHLLRHRLGTWGRHRPVGNRAYSHRNLPFADAGEPLLAGVLPVRPVGMDMAHAQLRQDVQTV